MTAVAVAWSLVGVALVALPDPRTPPSGTADAPDPAGTSTRERRARLLAGAALVAASVALFGFPAGVAIGAVAGPLAVLGLHRLARRSVPPPVDRRLALALDLTAAALRAGRPLADALAAAAPAAEPGTSVQLVRVAHLLRLGAPAELAWSGLRDDGGPLAGVPATAARSAASGLRLAAAFERLAGEVRAEVAAGSAARAHRAGVHAMAPLAACFLPSFVCLGIVPVVVGIAREAFGVLP